MYQLRSVFAPLKYAFVSVLVLNKGLSSPAEKLERTVRSVLAIYVPVDCLLLINLE